MSPHGSCSLFNDPLEDTEIVHHTTKNLREGSSLFNDPLEDTEIDWAHIFQGEESMFFVQRSVRGYWNVERGSICWRSCLFFVQRSVRGYWNHGSFPRSKKRREFFVQRSVRGYWNILSCEQWPQFNLFFVQRSVRGYWNCNRPGSALTTGQGSLFNDPLEDTEIIYGANGFVNEEVLCSTIR